jgi:hypothetical protein
LTHPKGVAELIARTDWWLALHLIHLPLFGLLGLAGCWLSGGLRGWAADLSRGALGAFVVCYSAFDALAGIATGVLVHGARGLPADQQLVITQAVERIFAGPVNAGLFLAGTFAWVVGLLAAAIALYRAGRPLPPLILLAVAGLLLLGDHPVPFGPLAFGCFFLAAAWLELVAQRAAPVVVAPS